MVFKNMKINSGFSPHWRSSERCILLCPRFWGDFNMIRSLTERKGGTRILGRESIAFENFINDMRLVDIETINGTFTWSNKRGGGFSCCL